MPPEDELVPPARQPTPPIMSTIARRHILSDELLKLPLLGNGSENNDDDDERRYKIEYVPVARPLDTFGGRKLEDIDRQLAEVQARRQVRGHDELGSFCY